MAANARAAFITERLERKRQRDHLAEEIVEAHHRAPIDAHLQILTQTDAILREAPLSLRIGRNPASERLEHQPEGFTKRVRIALAAATALESDPSPAVSLDRHVLPRAAGGQSELERLQRLTHLITDRGRSGGPPLGHDLEAEVGRAAVEPLDLDTEFGHPGLGKQRRNALKISIVALARIASGAPARVEKTCENQQFQPYRRPAE
jgi:hypothetical protein